MLVVGRLRGVGRLLNDDIVMRSGVLFLEVLRWSRVEIDFQVVLFRMILIFGSILDV